MSGPLSRQAGAVEKIAAAAYKTLVDRIDEEHRFRLPDYALFKEYIRPSIELYIVEARLDEHENTRPDLIWRMERRRALMHEKFNLEAQVRDNREIGL